MKKEVFAFTFIILMLGIVVATNCPPSIPKTYSGEVYYKNSGDLFKKLLDDAEYPLRVVMGSDTIGVGTIVGGVYSISVSPCFGYTGDVSFIINGVEANLVGSYEGQDDWGAEEELELLFAPKPPKDDTCGDNAIQLGEECDGINLGAITSCGEGWVGIVSCTASCTIDYSDCSLAPYCGDGIVNNGEDCSSCPQDAGECPVEESSGSSGGGGGGGGGSSGGSYYAPKQNVSTNETVTNTEELSLTSSENFEENPEENEEVKQSFFRTTGNAVSDFTKTKTGKGVLVVIGIVLIVGIFMFFSTKRKKLKGN